MQEITVASVQFCHVAGDKTFNMERVRHFVVSAAENDVDLIVFPEMCLTGYWHVRHLERDQIEPLAERVPHGPSTAALLFLACRTGMTIGAGLIEKGRDGSLYNTYVVCMPDGTVQKHRKLHCFISPHLSSGDSYTVFDTPHGVRVGVLICYDNNIGENVRITALKGAEVLLAPHQTGGCRTPSPMCMGGVDLDLWRNREDNPAAIEAELKGPKGREWLLRWLPARAHDNGLFLIFSNGIGIDDDEVRTGNAMILGPYGEILAETWKAADEMVIAKLDPSLRDMCTGVRWIRSRRPELYGMLTERTGREEDTRAVRFEGLQ